MDIEIKPVWKAVDEALRADAVAFWDRLGVKPVNVSPEQRARELCVVAKADDGLAGLTTITLVNFEQLRQRFAFFRVMIDPEYRRRQLMRDLNQRTLEVMEQWSLENPDEKLAGIMTTYVADFLNAPDRDQAFRLPISERMGLILVGYTPQDEQIRVRWFAHALL